MMNGRRTKLTPEIIREISEHVRNGSFYKDAAILSGITTKTFHEWRNKGEADEKEGKTTLHSDFLHSLRQAEAIAKAEAIRYIQRSDDWKARAWYLERKYSDEYSLKQKIEHSSDEEKPLRVTLSWD